MPTFVFRAKDGPDRTVDGRIEADSESGALAQIVARGYTPVWVRLEEVTPQKAERLLAPRITQRDVTVFLRQLASLIHSGVPILRALATIRDQTHNPRLARIVDEIRLLVQDGTMLSDSLARFSKLFTKLDVNLVRAGESAGSLDTVLARLAEAREREEETRRKAQAALAYPLLVLAVGAATIFVLLAFFLPRVLPLFRGFNSLPWPTRLLLGLSRFFGDYWHLLVLGVLLLAAIIKRGASHERGRRVLHALKLHAPLVGRFVLHSEIARFARTLALLIRAGIPIDQALTLSGNVLRNVVLRDEIFRVREQTVGQGLPFSAGLARTQHFPRFLANMVGVGEEAGRLDETLGEVAAFYERESEQQARVATSLLEPILILLVGAVVGLIVAAMLLPVFQLGMGLSPRR
ncbi:MAG: type II secretion system F family protein [Kiritimatiellia bacterium]